MSNPDVKHYLLQVETRRRTKYTNTSPHIVRTNFARIKQRTTVVELPLASTLVLKRSLFHYSEECCGATSPNAQNGRTSSLQMSRDAIITFAQRRGKRVKYTSNFFLNCELWRGI